MKLTPPTTRGFHPADLTRALRAADKRRRAKAAAERVERAMTVPPAHSMPAWGHDCRWWLDSKFNRL